MDQLVHLKLSENNIFFFFEDVATRCFPRGSTMGFIPSAVPLCLHVHASRMWPCNNEPRYPWFAKLPKMLLNYYPIILSDTIMHYLSCQAATGGIQKDLFDHIQRFAEDDPDVISSDTSLQLAKVDAGNYAYITDRTPLLVRAISDKSCRLTVAQHKFMPLPMGIGLQKGSPYIGMFQRA